MDFIKIIAVLALVSCGDVNLDAEYFFPAEDLEHEGTWLQWPHDRTYGEGNRDELEPIWVAMTEALSTGEDVYIIAYDEMEKSHILSVLGSSSTDMSRVHIMVAKTDDTWVRDNGPLFVFDKDGKMYIQNWKFNGWGKKCPFLNDDKIPSLAGDFLDLPVIDVGMVLEGGSFETDGKGTCIATRSSITNSNRNPLLGLKGVERYLSKYLGFSNFIWLDGVVGADITDFHIDGFVKFLDEKTIITMSEDDLATGWGVPDKDIDRLFAAKNSDGRNYDFVFLPLTSINVDGLDYQGSYLNFYIGNSVVLVPNYGDVNDDVANGIISRLYPGRQVVGIDVRALYKYGGMIHCVTQQQPKSKI
ncbi:MAG: agmatine deiminase family protein [Spirochaetales bacterium]|nr:agmatine deiminase family protein [Spirochaetales bacterium]